LKPLARRFGNFPICDNVLTTPQVGGIPDTVIVSLLMFGLFERPGGADVFA